MNTEISSLWKNVPPNARSRVKETIVQAANRSSGPVEVYFRADDIGIPDPPWERLTGIFLKHQSPLAAAVVPAWITPSNWQSICDMGRKNPGLWCWHQHGFRHVNHEISGKKQEFGPGRDPADICADIKAGRRKLETILGKNFTPVFTPPWNRCGSSALEHLKQDGYLAVSRDQGSRPDPPAGLPDWYVNVDLHTRKESHAETAWTNFLAELGEALSGGRAGIMIHHLRMNDVSFDFLDFFLSEIRQHKKIRLVNWCHWK